MKLKSLILLLAVFALLSGCGTSYEPNWQTFKDDSFHFSVESPFPLVKDEKSSTAEHIMFQTPAMNGKFQIILSSAKVGAGSKELKDIPGVMISALESMKIFTDFKTESKETTLQDIPAIATEGTFKMFKVMPRRLRMIDVKNDTGWWEVLIQCETGNEDFEKMADRVIKSLKIIK
jgi:hypothetical protein